MNILTTLTAAAAFSMATTAANAHDPYRPHPQHQHRNNDACSQLGKSLVLNFAAGILSTIVEPNPRAQERELEETVRNFEDDVEKIIRELDC